MGVITTTKLNDSKLFKPIHACKFFTLNIFPTNLTMPTYPIETKIGDIVLNPPWMNASGFLATPPAFRRFSEYRTGGVVSKTIMNSERNGHESPVFVEGEDGSFYNAVGMSGQGIEKYVEEMRGHYPLRKPMITSVASDTSHEDLVEVALRALEVSDAIEANYGCPNVEGGMIVGQKPELTELYTSKLKEAMRDRVLMVKLTPNVADITLPAKAAADGGADALVIANTHASRYINPYTREPHLTFKKGGGRSGRNVFEDTLRLVDQVAGMRGRGGYHFKIFAVGGIDGSEKAKRCFDAGADCLQFGTHLFLDRPMELGRATEPELETVKQFLERMENEIYEAAT
jgi:dihydroorotate dehydrogenase (NAD+) catalytic subunit